MPHSVHVLLEKLCLSIGGMPFFTIAAHKGGKPTLNVSRVAEIVVAGIIGGLIASFAATIIAQKVLEQKLNAIETRVQWVDKSCAERNSALKETVDRNSRLLDDMRKDSAKALR